MFLVEKEDFFVLIVVEEESFFLDFEGESVFGNFSVTNIFVLFREFIKVESVFILES